MKKHVIVVVTSLALVSAGATQDPAATAAGQPPASQAASCGSTFSGRVIYVTASEAAALAFP